MNAADVRRSRLGRTIRRLKSAPPPGIFADPELNRRFHREGYVVVRLVEVAIAHALRAQCELYGPAPGDSRDGLFNDTWSTDVTFKAEVAELLSRFLDSAIEAALTDYRVLGLTRISKWPGNAGAVVAHRDPTFVEEPKSISVGVWFALEATDVTQGTMHVVPRSHLLASGTRCHQSALNLYPDIDSAEGTFSSPVLLEPGEALLYYHRLIHSSPPNNSDKLRTVVGGIAVPRSAAATYAIGRTETTADLVEIDSTFFVVNQLNVLDEEKVLRDWPRSGSTKLTDGSLDLESLGRLQAG